MKQRNKAMKKEIKKILKALQNLEDMQTYKGVYIDYNYFENMRHIIFDTLNIIEDDEIT